MELQNAEINTIENIIHKTRIPYEGIKIELIDHLASAVEYKMERNPKLSFEEALPRVSHNMKETIIHIKSAMTKKTIKDMIRNSFDFSNWLTMSMIIFFGAVSFIALKNLGAIFAPIGFSFCAMSIIAFIIMKRRLRHIDVSNNYKLSVQKDFAWIPLISVGGICFVIALTSQVIMSFFNGGFSYTMLLIPMSLAYGMFIKSIIDVTILNVRKINEDVELDEMFETFSPSTFELV